MLTKPHILLLFAACWVATIQAQTPPQVKALNRLPESINTTSEEGLPVAAPDGSLYFVRTLFDGNVGGKLSGQDIWVAKSDGQNWMSAENASKPLNTPFNNAVVGIGGNGNVLYLNGTYSTKPDYQLGLSISERVDGEWTKPKPLHIAGFNPKSPYITYYVSEAHGVMLISFAERRDPNNEDLYLSHRGKGNRWGKPVNLGLPINSPQAEFSPFLSSDGRTLYFSSNGFDGLGNFDIYKSQRIGEGWTEWTEPMNLGAPVNSSGFEGYYSLFDTNAFFASNRDGAMGDIYLASYQRPVKPVLEQPSKAQLAADEGFSLSGFAAGSQPIKTIGVLNEEGRRVAETTANSDGSFSLKGLSEYSRYSLQFDENNEVEIFITHSNGDRVYLNRDLATGAYPFETLERDIKAVLVADVVDGSALDQAQFVFDDGSPIPAGSTIYLKDADNRAIETVVVNKAGGFEFKSLKNGYTYQFEFEAGTLDANSTVYMRMGDERVAVSSNILKGALFKKMQSQLMEISDVEVQEIAQREFDRLEREKLETHQTASTIDDGAAAPVSTFNYDALQKAEAERKLAAELADAQAKDAATFGFEYGKLPPAGSRVALIDADGNVVDEALTSEMGLFRFQKLDPDKSYSIKLLDEDDGAEARNLFVLGDDGEQIPLAQTTGEPLVAEALAPTVANPGETLFAFNYKALPAAGSKVYLTDANNQLVDSAYVDAQGNFKFKKLDPNQQYLMRLAEEDQEMGIQYFAVDPSGQELALSTSEKPGDAVRAVEAVAQAPVELDKFSFELGNAPKPGTTVFLTDAAGNVVDSSTVDAAGNFRFKKLAASETFLLKVDDEDFDLSQSQIYAVENNQRRKLSKLNRAFAVNSLELMEEEDVALNSDKFQIEYAGDIPDAAQAYLYDEVTGEVVAQAEITEGGTFSFRKLDPDRRYSLKFDEAIDVSNMRLFTFDEDEVKEEVVSGDDGFSFVPKPLERLNDEDQTTLAAWDKLAPTTPEAPIVKPANPAQAKPMGDKASEPTKGAAPVAKTETPAKPAAPKPAPPAKTPEPVPSDATWVVYFDFNEYLLKPEQVGYLRTAVVAGLKANPSATLLLEGHTDNVGSDEVNRRMAHLRLSNVVYHLEMNGIDETRMQLVAKGESEPAATNDSDEGRAKNRRVEMELKLVP